MKSFKLWSAVLVILVLSGVLLSATAFASDGGDVSTPTVMVSEPSTPVMSAAVRDLERSSPEHILNREEINPLKNPGLFKSDLGLTGTFTQKQDPLASKSVNSKLTPGTLFDFEGLGTDGYTPPDTVGEVGPNHYVQMVNVSFAIFDKTGSVLVPDTLFTDLYTGSGLTACEAENDGDPIVVYDEIADRWLLSQFAVSSGTRMCIAISQTADPTGAYWLYQFDMPDFPDYFKFGVWPDAYFMGTNTGLPNQYYAYAFDRASMLSGNPATFQYSNGHPNFLLPADLDGGMTSPPPTGSPGYFYTMLSDGYTDHPAGVDRLALYEFDVDWATPANSTFTLAQELPIAPYNYTVCGFFVGDCIPQPGTGQGLDSLSYWPMWRFAYRNLGNYEAMVGNFTVDLDGTDKAAIRWFELQKTGVNWTLNQEGTYAPDNDHRWMGSIAMDGSGNIALGYSVSSNTTTPAIRYTIHEVGDPLGTMQAEQQIIQSAGVHTGISRWGDYSSLNVDPADNCTFWYTNQYDTADNAGFDWHTRVGVFKIPGCTGSLNALGTLTGQVSDSGSNAISGALVSAANITTTAGTTTDAMGYYTRTLSVGSFDVTAEAYGFQPSTVSNVEIISGTTTTLDFSLTPAMMYTVDGTITDANTGWPLYAHVSISGDPFDPPVTDLWTDPATGEYAIDLAEGITYTFDVEAWVPGYLPGSAEVGPLTGDTAVDFALDVDITACNAPGYTANFSSALYDFEANNGGFIPDPISEWEWGIPTFPAGLTAHSGTNVWGTDLDADAEDTINTHVLTKTETLSAGSAVLQWWDWYGDEAADERQVYVDGTLVWDDSGGTDQQYWAQHEVDLSAWAGQTVDITFVLSVCCGNPGPEGWYIDDVGIGDESCDAPTSGGLVIGHVFDDNTNDPLNGAIVENEDDFTIEAVATPLDDSVDDGFYSIFSPSGSKTFTATMIGGYEPDVDTINVVANDTTSHDFSLPAGLLEVTPTGMAVTLDLGISTTLALNLDNAGAVDTNFEFTEVYGGFTPVLLGNTELGTIEWLYRNSEGITVPASDTDSGTTLAYPGAYRYTPIYAPDSANILVYTDDWIHTTPNTLVQQAISLMGIPATVHVDGDYTGFQNSLNSGGPWDLVVWSGENFVPDASLLTDLLTYLQGGGKLVATYWRQLDHPSDPLWTEMGFTYISNYVTPPPAYWWEASHPLFNNPENVPEWQNRVQNSGTSQGTRLEPLSNGQAIAGYTTSPATNEAGIILRDDGKALYKGLRDVSTNADDDGDSILDGTELWMNIFTNMLYSDVPWLSTDPITGTVTAVGNTAVDVTFDASAVSQPGEYFASLKIGEDTPYNTAQVPVTMTVNTPAAWGKVGGTLTLLGYCDINPTTPAHREILIEGSSGFTSTTSTDENGYYQWWIDPSESPLTVTVLPVSDYEDGMVSGVQIVTGQTTDVDFDLRWLQPCVSVDPTSYEKVVFQGNVITDTLALYNNGAISTTFELTTTGSLSWLSTDPLTGTVDADSMESIGTIFDSSVLTQTGWYSGELRVDSDDPMHGSILIPVDMAVVSGIPGVTLSPDSTLIGQPGTSVTHTFTVTNTGDVTDIYDLTLTGNNWVTIDPPEDTSFMDPGEIFTFTVTVEIPNNPTLLSAIIGSDTFNVMATSQLDGSSATAMGTTQAEVTTGVSLSSDQSDSGMVGGTVNYTLQVTNTGGYTDTFNLAVSGNAWVTELSEGTLTLGAGASGDLIVTVNIPTSASEGDLDLVTVTATSTLDAGTTDEAVLTTTAMEYWIYLPLISKP